jgi:CheY-like chemotaxis protein
LPAERPLRILIAEDNPINMKVMLRLLSRMGHTDVSAVTNGQDAVNAVLGAPANGAPTTAQGDGVPRLPPAREFDVVLMDVQMPIKDGLGATRDIVAEFDRSSVFAQNSAAADRVYAELVAAEKADPGAVALAASAAARGKLPRGLSAAGSANPAAVSAALARMSFKFEISGAGADDDDDDGGDDSEAAEEARERALQRCAVTLAAAGMPVIVALTASALRGDAEACCQAGMHSFLSKPVDVKRLEATLGQWIARRKGLGLLPPAQE